MQVRMEMMVQVQHGDNRSSQHGSDGAGEPDGAHAADQEVDDAADQGGGYAAGQDGGAPRLAASLAPTPSSLPSLAPPPGGRGRGDGLSGGGAPPRAALGKRSR